MGTSRPWGGRVFPFSKAVRIARELGYPVAMEEVVVEPLVPREFLEPMSLEAFFEELARGTQRCPSAWPAERATARSSSTWLASTPQGGFRARHCHIPRAQFTFCP